eukprot:365424-Chlamydomonas_euryale.AAC.4
MINAKQEWEKVSSRMAAQAPHDHPTTFPLPERLQTLLLNCVRGFPGAPQTSKRSLAHSRCKQTGQKKGPAPCGSRPTSATGVASGKAAAAPATSPALACEQIQTRVTTSDHV